MHKFFFALAAGCTLSFATVVAASADQSEDIAAIVAGGVETVAAEFTDESCRADEIVAEAEGKDRITQSAVGAGLARGQSAIFATDPDCALDIAAAVSAGPAELQTAFAVALVALAREADSGFGSQSVTNGSVGTVGGGNAGGRVGSAS